MPQGAPPLFVNDIDAVKRWIDAGVVRCNGATVKASQRVAVGDEEQQEAREMLKRLGRGIAESDLTR